MQVAVCGMIAKHLKKDIEKLPKALVTPNGDVTVVQRSKNLSARCRVAAKYAYKYKICQV